MTRCWAGVLGGSLTHLLTNVKPSQPRPGTFPLFPQSSTSSRNRRPSSPCSSTTTPPRSTTTSRRPPPPTHTTPTRPPPPRPPPTSSSPRRRPRSSARRGRSSAPGTRACASAHERTNWSITHPLFLLSWHWLACLRGGKEVWEVYRRRWGADGRLFFAGGACWTWRPGR